MTLPKARLPTFGLAHMTAATAYHFDVPERGGWAICTVNDASYELSVQSDWGTWAFRWHSTGMPTIGDGNSRRRMTFSEFVGARDSDRRCHYLADKLMTREQRERFCPRETVRALGMKLRYARRVDRISRDDHIDMAQALSELADTDDERDFVSHWNDLTCAMLVEREPWECFRNVPSNEYLILRDAILPALVKALIAQRVQPETTAT